MTLMHLLQQQAAQQPDKLIYHYLTASGDIEASLSYQQLDQDCRSLAKGLRQHMAVGDRCLLLFPQGLDFIRAFWACLYAGVVPLPVYPPTQSQQSERLAAIVADANASAALTNQSFYSKCQQWLGNQQHSDGATLLTLEQLLEENEPADAEWLSSSWHANGLAFIQYTSGSTGTPKGVPIYQQALLSNLAHIRDGFHVQRGSSGAGWLPLYHDMGLVGNVLSPVFVDCPVYLFSAQDFIRRPVLWLDIISRYRISTSGAPNFAYQYCIDKVSDEQLASLDLSCWQQAFCGAEPVSAATLQAFSTRFAACGFAAAAFLPCYGMAEATLFISGNKPLSHSARLLELDAAALQQGQVIERVNGGKTLVSCGYPAEGCSIKIVAPEQRQVLGERQIGEIWLASPALTPGYWQQAQLNARVFNQHPVGEPEQGYFRTGDLGFIADGQLYITGRLKEMIIIRGRNLYPADIEQQVALAHPAINPHRIAAFAAPAGQGEGLMVVAELERTQMRHHDPRLVWQALCARLNQQFSLAVSGGALLKPGQLPITSSGKIQRLACAAQWQAQSWNSLYHHAGASQQASARCVQLLDWLKQYGQRRLNSRQMDERRSLDPHLLLELGRRGFFGLNIPQQYGGLALAETDIMLLMQQLGALDVSVAAMLGVHLALGVTPILEHGTAEQQQRYLPLLASGQMLAAFAISEPQAGSNPRAMQSTLQQQADGWLLNGNKCWIGNAGWAGLILVISQCQDSQQQALGLTATVVDTSLAGVEIGPEAMTTGMRAMVQNSVWFNAVNVAPGDVLAAPGQGFAVAQSAMHAGRLGIMAICVGALRRSCQYLLQYAQSRQLAAGLLIEQAPIQQWLTEGLIKAELLARFSQRLAQRRTAQQSVSTDLYSIAKCLAPEWLGQTLDQVMQALGGRGYIEDGLVPQLWRDARLLRIFEGPTESLQSHLGQRLWQQPQQLRQAFSELGADNAYADLLAWQQSQTTAGDDKHQLSWRYYQSGAVVAWQLMAALAENDAEHAFIREGLAHARAQATRATSAMLAAAELSDIAQQLDAYIGPCGQNRAQTPTDIEARLPWQQVAISHQADRPGNAADVPEAVATASAKEHNTLPEPNGTTSVQAIEQWLCQWLQAHLPASGGVVQGDSVLAALGLDSIIAVECSVAIEQQWQITLPLEWFWQVPTVRALAQQLAKRLDITELQPLIAPAMSSSVTVAPDSRRLEEVAAVSQAVAPATATPQQGAVQPELSLFFFGNSEATTDENPYQFVLQSARFADEHGFAAVWTPERHFHAFGAAFSDPALLASAIAQHTSRIAIRAGSVVLPLHHPARIAEQWALVDQLSQGRAGLALTSGWNANDFILSRSDNYQQRQADMPGLIQQLQAFWQQEQVQLTNPLGEQACITTYPRPQQQKLPLWLTCNKRPEGFVEAGRLGLNLLSALLSQTETELAENIRQYRQARQQAGFVAAEGKVTLMVHCFVHDDEQQLQQWVLPALKDYLQSSADLWQQGSEQLQNLTAEQHQQLLNFALQRYRQQALIGTVAQCRAKIQRWQAMGVDEIACLIDFGLSQAQIQLGLNHLASLLPAAEPVVTPALLKPVCQRLTAARPLAKRLFCLAPAGTSVACYYPLAQALSDDWELWTLDYSALLDAKGEILPALLQTLSQQMQPLLDRPFALYGQSLGALLAFELARHLQQQGQLPMWLAVAAQHSPTLAYPHVQPDELLMATPEHPHWRYLQQLGLSENSTAQLIQNMLPGLRFQAQHYQYQPIPALQCPLHLLYGEQDQLVSQAMVMAWQQLTGNSKVYAVSGEHHFMSGAASEIAQLIANW